MRLGGRPTGAGKNHGCPAVKECFTQGRESRIERTIGKWRGSVKRCKGTQMHLVMQPYGHTQTLPEPGLEGVVSLEPQPEMATVVGGHAVRERHGPEEDRRGGPPYGDVRSKCLSPNSKCQIKSKGPRPKFLDFVI
jgi:hypothetical protein